MAVYLSRSTCVPQIPISGVAYIKAAFYKVKLSVNVICLVVIVKGNTSVSFSLHDARHRCTLLAAKYTECQQTHTGK